MRHLQAVLDHIDRGLDASRDRLFELLRIPSVGAQPRHDADCAAAAAWLRDQLAGIGFDAAVRPTAGQPVVLAHHPGPAGSSPGTPHLLYYGHYDVQPAEPLELWTSPPFEPRLDQGPHGPRIRARGAVDDKGQSLMWLEALRAWHAVAGGPPVRVTVLVEGEEETGSPSLDEFLQAHRDALRADVAVISDTNMWDLDTPGITTRLRGMVYTQLDLRAASRDLHSGLYGGSARNPLNLLARLLAGLQDETGRVLLPGFYDGVADVGAAQAARWDALGFDEARFLGKVGLSSPAGERGRPPLERLWARPTLDVNGMWGGYTGDGSKTVIPAEAHAKLSFRLVPGQQPERVAEALRRYVAANLPPDVEAEVQISGQASAMEVPADSRWVRAAEAALAEEYGRAPVLMGSGGSIPVVESLGRLLDLPSLLIGFGLDDDQVHSPNEKFELRCFHKGMRSHARLLGALAG